LQKNRYFFKRKIPFTADNIVISLQTDSLSLRLRTINFLYIHIMSLHIIDLRKHLCDVPLSKLK